LPKLNERVINAVTAVTSMVNSMGHEPKDFVELMATQHRTLQQNFTRVCVAWMEHLARANEQGSFDLRNEASTKLGKIFVENIEEVDRYLPYV